MSPIVLEHLCGTLGGEQVSSRPHLPLFTELLRKEGTRNLMIEISELEASLKNLECARECAKVILEAEDWRGFAGKLFQVLFSSHCSSD